MQVFQLLSRVLSATQQNRIPYKSDLQCHLCTVPSAAPQAVPDAIVSSKLLSRCLTGHIWKGAAGVPEACRCCCSVKSVYCCNPTAASYWCPQLWCLYDVLPSWSLSVQAQARLWLGKGKCRVAAARLLSLSGCIALYHHNFAVNDATMHNCSCCKHNRNAAR